MKVQYDAKVDALYIELHELQPGTAEARDLSSEITADYGPDGKLAGIEILDASQFLDRRDLHKVILEVSPALTV